MKILGCCVQGHGEHSKFQLMFVWMISILLPRSGTLFLPGVGGGGCCFAFRTNQGFNRRYFIHVLLSGGERWRFLCRSQDLSSSIHTAEYSNTTTTLPIFSLLASPPSPSPPPPPPPTPPPPPPPQPDAFTPSQRSDCSLGGFTKF